MDVMEFDVRKAWNLWGCNQGPACCPGAILVRTRDNEFIVLAGRVSSSDYHFSFQDSDFFDGTTVVIERWPRTKAIYRALFDGDPIEYVHVSDGEPRWEMPRSLSHRLFTGRCEIVADETLKELPQALLRELLAD